LIYNSLKFSLAEEIDDFFSKVETTVAKVSS
jgi:hypothetical protein